MLFGSCAPFLLWLLIRPQRLRLDSEGFALEGGFVWSPKKVRWNDVDEFFVYRPPRGGKLIGYNYRPVARQGSPLSWLIRRFGADAALPKGWPRSPEKMTEELNAYRRSVLGAEGGFRTRPTQTAVVGKPIVSEARRPFWMR